MKNKLLLQTLNEETGEVINSYPCKGFKEVALILDMDYFQARKLYMHCKNPTKAHHLIAMRAKKFKIIDNPALNNDNINIPHYPI